MKILMLAQNRLDPRLGGPRVVIEVARGLRALGCEVTALGTDRLAAELGSPPVNDARAVARLYDRYLSSHAAEYDVVDYDHGHLPFPRERYPEETLFVARSVLLLLHLRHVHLPESPMLRNRLGRWLKPWKHRWARRRAVVMAHATLRESDLVNVSNLRDVALLTEEYHIPNEKIVYLPFGISRELATELAGCRSAPEGKVHLVMIGTFDYRKGCLDLPKLFRRVRAEIPEATLTLLGAKGLFGTEASILSRFHAADRGQVSVVMQYPPPDLPSLLDRKTIGIFPSYLEGFGIGVVEMLTAGIPVIAYDVPGPDTILERDALIEVGDSDAFATKVIEWAREDRERQLSRRVVARRSAERFRWGAIAVATLNAYRSHRDDHLRRMQGNVPVE